jgi:hypothetical protein
MMGDWDDMFGAGMSTESVIDSINQSWQREWRDAEEEERKERKKSLSVFRGDQTLKIEAQAVLAECRGTGRLISEHGGLKCLLGSGAPLNVLWDRYRIPAALACLADAIFWGLQRETGWSQPTAEEQTDALDWLFALFDAIEPGTDLRFVTDNMQFGQPRTAYASPVKDEVGTRTARSKSSGTTASPRCRSSLLAHVALSCRSKSRRLRPSQ